MLKKIKYALDVIFYSPKPKIKETEYIHKRKTFRINYDKYYTKKERFTLLMWSFTMLTFLAESMAYMILFWDNIIRLIFVIPLIFFYMIYMKNNSRMKEKYREKALQNSI